MTGRHDEIEAKDALINWLADPVTKRFLKAALTCGTRKKRLWLDAAWDSGNSDSPNPRRDMREEGLAWLKIGGIGTLGDEEAATQLARFIARYSGDEG